MPSFFNQTEFENEAINDSNHLLDTKTMTLEFVLFDTETKRGPTVSIGVGPKVVFGIWLLIVETIFARRVHKIFSMIFTLSNYCFLVIFLLKCK